MTPEYPEWLVDRVAEALYRNATGSEVIVTNWANEPAWVREEFREDATVALSALGIHRAVRDDDAEIWTGGRINPPEGES